ncbi:hypothetical protein ACFWB5_02485 [Corynebacterium xerosis]|uniref:hypothetical protein n=1 Tax=Corynebacterium xerosis TaxID=1725 RepID=UPI0036627B32
MIKTGAELWNHWTQKNILIGKTYDADLLMAIGKLLNPEAPHHETYEAAQIEKGLGEQQWTAQELIDAILPLLTSWKLMLGDLLELYQRIGANQADKDNLKIEFAFDRNNTLHHTLDHFRETIKKIEKVSELAPTFKFEEETAWNAFRNTFPLYDRRYIENNCSLLRIDNASELRKWNGHYEPFERTGNTRINQTLEDLEKTIAAYISHLDFTPDGEDLGQPTNQEAAIRQAETDHWIKACIIGMHQILSEYDEARPETLKTQLEKVKRFTSSFWSGPEEKIDIEKIIETVNDVLSLPEWGKRHEIYAAWLTTQIAKALKHSRMTFNVIENTLSFPFSGAKLAEIESKNGQLELWCEIRSEAGGNLGGGRKTGIQPDYRIVKRGHTPEDPNATILAIEAKQYWKSAKKVHGEALRDYSHNLPNAQVFLVANGPVSKNAIDLVDISNRNRVHVFRHTEPGNKSSCIALQNAISTLIPPPNPQFPRFDQELRFGRGGMQISLNWIKSVIDLDIRIYSNKKERLDFRNTSTSFGLLHADAFYGGPEIVSLFDTHAFNESFPVEVCVELYSSDAESVFNASPFIFIESQFLQIKLHPNPKCFQSSTKYWNVGTIYPNMVFKPSKESTVQFKSS